MEHVHLSHPLLVVSRGQQLGLTRQHQKSYQSDNISKESHLQELRNVSQSRISDRGDGLSRQAAWAQAKPHKLWKGPADSLTFRQPYICSSSSPLLSPSVVLMKLSRSCHSLMNGCASQHDG